MLQTMWQSAYSTSLYQEVKLWRGKSFAYLALVLAFCWLPMLVRGQVMFNRLMAKAETEIIQKIPVITYANGKITTPENRPYVLSIGGGEQKVEVIIDTSGKYTSLDKQTAQLLLTKDKLFIRKQSSGEVRTYDLSKGGAKSYVVDQPFWQKIMKNVRRWTVPILAPIIFLMSFLKRLIQAFFIALIGLALVSALDVELDLGSLLSLSIVSMTPAMLLETVWNLSNLHHRYAWLFWGVIILGNFIFAVNAAARPTNESSD